MDSDLTFYSIRSRQKAFGIQEHFASKTSIMTEKRLSIHECLCFEIKRMDFQVDVMSILHLLSAAALACSRFGKH